MYKIYLRIACRHLWRFRLYSLINIFGLGIGLTCVLLASLYMKDEYGFDTFQSPHLYRINSIITKEGNTEIIGGTGQVQGPAFSSHVPEVINFSRIMGGNIDEDVTAGDKALRLRLMFADDSFFDVFNFKLREGNVKTVLRDAHSVVITESTALSLFGHVDVVGQPLRMAYEPAARQMGKPLVISGIAANPPANSSIQFDILLPFKFLQLSFDDTSWINAYLGTFILLHPNAEISLVEQKFNKIQKMHVLDRTGEVKGESGSDLKVTYQLQRMTDIHLNPEGVLDKTGEDGVVNGSKPIYSYMFLAVAVFILLMASINFININIANSMKRTKEIGVRKVTGGSRLNILLQFFLESLFLSSVAFLFAICFSILLLPIFNQLSGKQISLDGFKGIEFFGWASVIFIANVIISGLYPALFLSRLSPVQVLYNRYKQSSVNLLSASLVTFQFFAAILLGICTFVMYQQMNYVETKDLGYSPIEIIRFKIPGLSDTKNIASYLKNELKNESQITQLSTTGEFGSRDTKVNGHVVKAYYRSIDSDYLPMLQIKLKAGRNFSESFPSDKKYGIIVNEAFLEATRLINPLGVKVSTDPNFSVEPFSIIGVVQNFHTHSFREEIQPMIMFMSEQYGGDAILTKIKRSSQEQVLPRIQTAFQNLVPGAAFDYTFLEEENAREYSQELRWMKIVSYASSISIFICCIGLFALMHLSVNQRVRETGIRIVLGATLADIGFLFMEDFLKLIVLAVLIASPVAYYLMEYWLDNFAYRTHIQWWVFALSGSISMLIAMVTIGPLILKAGRTNPADSLKIG